MSKAWEHGSSARWRRFRALLLEHWAQQGRTSCEILGRTCTGVVQQVDHIQPLSKGGQRYDPTNCRPACQPCNTARGASGVVPQPAPRPTSTW